MDGTARLDGSKSRSRIVVGLLWALLWLLAGIISIEFLLNVYGKYRFLDSQAYQMFLARRGWLWVHLAGGALTLLLGPLQFLSQWRRRYPRLHRHGGRIYMVGMLVACTGAVGLISTSPAPPQILQAFAATGLAWLGTALAGLVAIRRGRIASHRRWMIRNYLVTLAPVTFRLLLPLAISLGHVPSPTLIAILLWSSWLLPLLVGEVVRRLAGMRAFSLAGEAREIATDPPSLASRG